eukprot:SAG31_NODE_748_length_12390_cov_6.306484_13_plen_110_part_00
MLLLFRILELDEGSISIDGSDISTLGLAQLRRAIAMLPQVILVMCFAEISVFSICVACGLCRICFVSVVSSLIGSNSLLGKCDAPYYVHLFVAPPEPADATFRSTVMFG